MAKGNLLVVDDEDQIRFFLESFFKKDVDKVFSADSGKTAMEIVQKEEIHAIISDLRMPEFDGLKLLKTLKEEKHFIPIALISAYGSEEILRDCLNNGAIDFLSKPFMEKYLKHMTIKMLDFGLAIKQNSSQKNIESYVEEETEKLKSELIEFKENLLGIL